MYCILFSAKLFGGELPECTVIRYRVFVSSYLRVELGGVESVSTQILLLIVSEL